MGIVRSAASISAAVAIVVSSASLAHAGRRDHSWLRGADVMPERMVELETWVFERRGLFDAVDDTWLAWQPVVGVTDQLELALPIEVILARTTAGDDLPTEARYGVEARYRLVTADPLEAPALVPLIRFSAGRGGADNTGRFELGAAAQYSAGPVRISVDVGALAVVRRGQDSYVIKPAIAVSVRAVGDLRVGAEAYGELDARDPDRRWFAVGPDLAWTHGRLWVTASIPIGITNIEIAPRIGWGIAF